MAAHNLLEQAERKVHELEESLFSKVKVHFGVETVKPPTEILTDRGLSTN